MPKNSTGEGRQGAPARGGMTVELLYFDGCPSYVVTEERLRYVLAEQGVATDIVMIRIEAEEEAQRLRFPGSPTIRVDGQDLFPTDTQRDGVLGCRIYATPDGLAGAPTLGMIAQALERGWQPARPGR